MSLTHPLTDLGDVAVVVRHDTLARALASVARDGGWSVRQTVGPSTFAVTDRVIALDQGQDVGWRRLLVVDPTPIDCRRAMDAIGAGTVLGVLLSDEPDELLVALRATSSGRASVPGRVVELAARMPQLTDRQAAILAGVLAGQTNAELGKGLRLSHASVKREMGELFRAFGLANRLALAHYALSLGIRPARVVP